MSGADPRAGLSARWTRAFDWVEERLGGRIVRAERQPRWRPAWFLDVDCAGEIQPVYFRGDRGEADHGVYGLEHEQVALEGLAAQGIPVPHVYGFCPEPRGIVMERAPGRANLATAASEAERERVLDHYVEILARIHALDVAPFEAAGMKRPSGDEARALMDLPGWERAYRRRKRRPEPAVEFLLGWVRGHVPGGRERVSFVCCDSGQFLFEDGRVTAVIDLELAGLGDPAADLAGMRGRDLSEPLGDLSRAFRHYARQTGEPVDRAAVDFHTVRFGLVTPLATSHLVADPPPGLDRIQYLSWYLVWTRAHLEVVAGASGIALDPPALPDGCAPAPSARAGPGGFADYERDAAAREAELEERRSRFGPALEADDRADLFRLLGTRDGDDAALEQRVREAPPGSEPDLLRVLHRRLLRQEALLGPALRELAGVRIQPL